MLWEWKHCSRVNTVLINDKMATMISIVMTKMVTFIAVAMGISEMMEESGQAGWLVWHQAEDV